MSYKKCRKCKIILDIKEFHNKKSSRDGLDYICKKCKTIYRKQYREKNLEIETRKQADWRNKNRDKYLAYMKKYNSEYYKEHSDRIKRHVRCARLQNPEKAKARCAQYRKKNRDKINKYVVKRKSENIQYRLAHNLRKRLNCAIKNGQKVGSAISDLGCSVADLVVYLEALFAPGMSWHNYGEWHIDHKKPLSLFDLTDYKQVKQACHYTNLQPLWQRDNLSKGNRLV